MRISPINKKNFFTLLLLLFYLFSGCQKERLCNVAFSDYDLLLYKKIAKQFFQELKNPDMENNIDITKEERYSVLLDNVSLKPYQARRQINTNNIILSLKKEKKWYMEIDYLYLVVSVDSINHNSKFDSEDLQYRLNCEKILDENILIRSVTVQN